MKIDVIFADDLNEEDNNKKGNTMLEEVKQKIETVVNALSDVQTAVSTAADAPNVDQAIVAALVAALEAQGYTVTPPAAPEA